ncbi:MAG: hypothetical protein QGG17_03140 [Rhodospirillales bacterium]|nr:hypothetical protein [Rhodospirillales bacterium]
MEILKMAVWIKGAERALRDVFLNGVQVVKDRKVTTLDHAGALELLTEMQARMLRNALNRDYRGRKADEIAPLWSSPIELVHR